MVCVPIDWIAIEGRERERGRAISIHIGGQFISVVAEDGRTRIEKGVVANEESVGGIILAAFIHSIV